MFGRIVIAGAVVAGTSAVVLSSIAKPAKGTATSYDVAWPYYPAVCLATADGQFAGRSVPLALAPPS